ncbi:carboxylate--amine ligase [Nesterenkonia sp. MY13]|uniref:Carboxylate--amine ligase n=1 Tax=Nesterenkonia sedimenti TaxID=1463632 RepID=A0A7X8YF40_9MICC|nr:carboxylate--amine ligase [Nesterenkonia sedimenti]NLS10991.1 carboxylate--amine ligase [Nesterenkonia sedimenti]
MKPVEAARRAGFQPVILGTNIHGYTHARSFHETYGVKPVMIGKIKLGFTWDSGILDVELHENLDDDAEFLRILTERAEELTAERGVPLLLVPSTDIYVELVTRHRAALEEHFLLNTPEDSLRQKFMDKERFYQLASEYGVDIPETQVHKVGEPFELEVDRFPVIIKPANPNAWWRNQHKIAGHRKVYRLNTAAEVREVVTAVEASDYRDGLIIQEFIPGDDTNIWDAVLYLNTEGKCELVTLGRVALQEHESHLVGSYTAIISRFDEALMTKYKDFLEAVGYTGVANVDIKFDPRDGVYKVMEINARPGRSSYYTALLGHPLMKYLVDDLVFGRRKELTLAKGDVLFHVAPRYILRKYVTNPEVRAEVKRLIKAGKATNPLWYRGDRSPKRMAYLAGRHLRQGKKYAASTWRDGL